MKTIEEAAKGYSDGENLEEAFKAGVRFSQRWISCVEEKPKVGDDVIVRFFCNGWNYEILQNISGIQIFKIVSRMFEWRPIEYK